MTGSSTSRFVSPRGVSTKLDDAAASTKLDEFRGVWSTGLNETHVETRLGVRVPTRGYVDAACGLFTGSRVVEGVFGVTLDGRGMDAVRMETVVEPRVDADGVLVESQPLSISWPNGYGSPARVETAGDLFGNGRISTIEVRRPVAGYAFAKTLEVTGNDPRGPLCTVEHALHPGRKCDGSHRDHCMIEGPRWRVEVTPGSFAVRYQDPVRAARAVERAKGRERAGAVYDADGKCVGYVPQRQTGKPSRVISSWSNRSRERLRQTVAALDYQPFFEQPGLAAMLTVTLPRDWLAVAPNHEAMVRALDKFRLRFYRAWGRKLIGLWKREFQHRHRGQHLRCHYCEVNTLDDSGRAPHYHFFAIVPDGLAAGRGPGAGLRFEQWFALTWADCVGAASCGLSADECDRCCERHNHEAHGVDVEYAKGLRAQDPQAIADYFMKHGAFAAKDYQNQAPDEWLETGDGVGGYWGVWGLKKARGAVEVSPQEGLAASRLVRRMTRARNIVHVVDVWESRTVVDADTGEVTTRWVLKRKRKRWRAFRDGRSGVLVTPDGPALASSVARALDAGFGRATGDGFAGWDRFCVDTWG